MLRLNKRPIKSITFMNIYVDAICDIGLVRENNEDLIAIHGQLIRDDKIKTELEVPLNQLVCFAVADGMGGHNGGEVASEMVLKDLTQTLETLQINGNFVDLKEKINHWVHKIHDSVVNLGNNNLNLINMGTTLICLMIYNERIYYINIGDSRLYRLRKKMLKKISKDHSMREFGGIPNAPSNLLLNSIGGGESVFCDFEDLTDYVFNNDVFILCSDGLSDLVNNDEIEEILNKGGKSLELVDEAKKKGGKDNISVVYISVNY
jgi:protein phosphatase